MKSNVVFVNIARFFVLAIIQVLVFKRIAFNWGDFAFIHLIIYPLFLILLPIKTPRPVVIFLGFLLGLFVDLFYDSPGLHASAAVFTGYARGILLDFIEPYEGYNTTDSPNVETMGIGWFMTFSSILFGLHLIWYFSVEAFSFVFFFEILLNTIFSFIASFIIVMLLLLIFRPKT